MTKLHRIYNSKYNKGATQWESFPTVFAKVKSMVENPDRWENYMLSPLATIRIESANISLEASKIESIFADMSLQDYYKEAVLGRIGDITAKELTTADLEIGEVIYRKAESRLFFATTVEGIDSDYVLFTPKGVSWVGKSLNKQTKVHIDNFVRSE